MATSEANIFDIAAMGASARPVIPASTMDAVLYTSWRAASVCVTMSAIIQRTPWKSLTFCLKATRSWM
ncbi:hypothetical protein D3C84_1177150 [compost metagenome]